MNLSYLEFSATIKGFVKSLQCLRLNDVSQQRMGTRKDRGVKLGPLPAQSKSLDSKSREDWCQCKRSHVPICIFPLAFPSHLHSHFTSQCPIHFFSSEQADVLIRWYIDEEGVYVPVCTHVYSNIRKAVLDTENATKYSPLRMFSKLPSFYLVALT